MTIYTRSCRNLRNGLGILVRNSVSGAILACTKGVGGIIRKFSRFTEPYEDACDRQQWPNRNGSRVIGRKTRRESALIGECVIVPWRQNFRSLPVDQIFLQRGNSACVRI